MIIYLPFDFEYNYYAVDFKFRPGKYLFDFDIKTREKIYLDSNTPFWVIKKIRWKKRKKKLEKSIYANDNTYDELE